MLLQTKRVPKEMIWVTIEELCILCGPSRDVITETGIEVSSVGREPAVREDLSTKAEKFPLLEAVTMRRLVKTVID
jgi:hypothetical protein